MVSKAPASSKEPNSERGEQQGTSGTNVEPLAHLALRRMKEPMTRTQAKEAREALSVRFWQVY